ncbi:MAG: carboxypeptidase regulatory-like domain-containing protein [Planctomycetaceae bacterium]|nr:carboxypeptidase regulatory-like domain-containing protein [Planctomycetaceae bacterium]
MKCLHTLTARKAIVALTMIALITPAPPILAADARPAAPKPLKLKTVDVELQSNGTLEGYYVDGEQGAGKSGVSLTLHQNAAEPIAKTKTGENGAFQFTGLKAGTYQVVANDEHVMAYRAWTPGTAPPRTAKNVVFATQEASRAGLWFAGLPPALQLAIIAALVAAVAVPIAIAADDDDKKNSNSEDGNDPG